MRSSFAQLKAGWGGHAPFESWFDEGLNNAHLASVATYFSCVPGFERELAASSGNLAAFYVRVRELAKRDQKERDSILCGAS
jgi:predicted aminopeptidase